MKLYHGTVTAGIETLKPMQRYVPGSDEEKKSAIYATDLPAYAAAHSFPWSTDEGVELYIEENDQVSLHVPKSLEDRLKQHIYIYHLNGEGFTTVDDPLGHNFRTFEAVNTIACQRFDSVKDAVESLGGKVHIKI